MTIDAVISMQAKAIVPVTTSDEFTDSFSQKVTLANAESPLILRTCQKCLKEATELKVLFCQHSICRICVDRLNIKNKSYKCPVCNKDCPSPNGGFGYLPHSLFAHQLTEILQSKERANVTLEDLDLSDLKAKLSEELFAGERWMRKALQMIGIHQVQLIEIQGDHMQVQKNIEDFMCETVELCEDKLSSVARGMADKKSELHERLQSFQSYIELRKSVSLMVKKLAGETCASEDLEESVKLLEDLSKAYSHAQELINCLEGGTEPEVGDSVRFKFEVAQDFEKFIRGSVTHASIGILLEKHPEDGEVSAIFPENHLWKGSISLLDKSLKKAKVPYIGDEVRVLVEQPYFGWQSVQDQNGSGKLTRTDLTESAPKDDFVIYIDFPEVQQWKGLYSELFQPKPVQMQLSAIEMMSQAFLQLLLPSFELPRLASTDQLLAITNTENAAQMSQPKQQAAEETNKISKELEPMRHDKKGLRSCLQQLADRGASWCKDSAATFEAFRKRIESWKHMEKALRDAAKDYQQDVQRRCSKKVQQEDKEKSAKERAIAGYINCLQDCLESINKAKMSADKIQHDVFNRNQISSLNLLQAQRGFFLLKFANEQVRRIRYGVDSFWEPNGGDCVRLRAGAFSEYPMSQYLREETIIGSVGLLMRSHISEPEAEVLFPGDKAPRMVKAGFVHEILTKRALPFKGDKVRLKRMAITLQPHTDNSRVSTSGHGILKEMFPIAMVKFPGQEELWRGAYKDIELVPGCEFEPGDKVWVRRTIPVPLRGWGGVTRSSVGIVRLVEGGKEKEEITVDFPECKGWVGPATDLQMVRDLWLANEVQVKLTVTEPRNGWQSVGKDDVGYVLTINGDECVVGFSANPRFRCHIDEIEPCRYAKAQYDKTEEEKEDVIYTTPEEMRLLYLYNF